MHLGPSRHYEEFDSSSQTLLHINITWGYLKTDAWPHSLIPRPSDLICKACNLGLGFLKVHRVTPVTPNFREVCEKL